MFDFSPIQIVIVLVIALLLFGPKRLPEMGRTLGRGLREFKSSVIDDGDAPPPRPAPATAHAAATTAAVEDDADEADEVLEGVVVPGQDSPERPPG